MTTKEAIELMRRVDEAREAIREREERKAAIVDIQGLLQETAIDADSWSVAEWEELETAAIWLYEHGYMVRDVEEDVEDGAVQAVRLRGELLNELNVMNTGYARAGVQAVTFKTIGLIIERQKRPQGAPRGAPEQGGTHHAERRQGMGTVCRRV